MKVRIAQAVLAAIEKTSPTSHIASARKGEHRVHKQFIRHLSKIMKLRSLIISLSTMALYSQQFTDGQAARLVIGQRTFTDESPGDLSDDKNTILTSDMVLGGVGGLAYANNQLLVADSSRAGATPNNNRVLIYNELASLVPGPTAAFKQGGRCNVCLGPASVVLGQPTFTSSVVRRDQSGLRLPTAVASDGHRVAIADTDNNRVMLWLSTPTTNGQPADVVIGQEDFTRIKPPVTDERSLRGPQGVWIQDGRLFVADTQNHRVLIYNSIPTANGASADVVLGQPDFSKANAPNPKQIREGTFKAEQNTLFSPVSVTSDGTRLFVSDLGHNRILIWNSIPTTNQQAADIVLGQPDFTSVTPNNSSKVCQSRGTDPTSGNPIFPRLCAASLSFPRHAISDGNQLFVADSGNDRVLIWTQLPAQNGQPANVALGQLTPELNNTTDGGTDRSTRVASAADVMRTPTSLAWDGINLYVSDSFNRRILVFTPGVKAVSYTGVRNSASFITYALGSVTLSGTVTEGVEIVLKIRNREYKYKVVKDDAFDGIVNALSASINAGGGDQDVIASSNLPLRQIVLTAKDSGEAGNAVTYSISFSDRSTLRASTGGGSLTGGQDAARIAPGTLVSIVGEKLSELTEKAPLGAASLPTTLGNVEVYFDGIRSPLLYVSPNQINAQVPWEVHDATSVSAVVRTQLANGSVQSSSAVAVPIINQNPGIYTQPSTSVDPRPGVVLHGSSFATGTISVDGTVEAGDIATIIIDGNRRYSYTLRGGDTKATVRDALIRAINEGNDPDVSASAAGVFERIRLQARRPGPAQNGTKIGVEVKGKDTTAAKVILSPFNSVLCCANIQGSLVTAENPAVPGETIIIYATGLGLIRPNEAKETVRTGQIYAGPEDNQPAEAVDSIAGDKTAQVIFARLKRGTVGLFELFLELNSELPTNPVTQLRIAQRSQISNRVTFNLRNPSEPRQ